MIISAIGEILFDVYNNHKTLGGAPFNFIYHIHNLIGNINFVSRIGSDDSGKEIIRLLKKRNFPADFIQLDDKNPTGTVNVSLNDKKIPTFTINENVAYDYIEWKPELKKIISKSDLIYFGTLAQRNFTTRNTIHKIKEYNLKLFCDINLRQKYWNEQIISNSLEGSVVVKISEDEFSLICKLMEVDGDTEQRMKMLRKKFNIELLCLTLGENGSILMDEEKMDRCPINKTKIINTVGAGDAFSAILAIGYLKHWNIEKTNKLANEFASAICRINSAIPEDNNFYNKFKEKINV